MLLLRRSVLAHLLSSPISHLHRLLSTAAAAVPPNPSFAVKDYLVATCGLTRAQALKASTKISHLRSPTKPDAVLAFLAGLGLSSADVAGVVAKDPLFLCARVEGTLRPVVAGLAGLGLSRTEIARLVSLVPFSFRQRNIVSNLPYYPPLFGSFDNFLQVLKHNTNLLGSSVDKVVKPNLQFLRECGLSACDITKLGNNATWLLTINPDRLPMTLARAEGLGVPRGSAMFRHALRVVAFREEKIAAQVEILKNMFRWSEAEVGVAVCKFPSVLTISKGRLQSQSEFLISELDLEPAYVARRPVMLGLSLERRLRPRYYALKFLKENGLLKRDRDYYSTLMFSEKAFVEKFICPHKEASPYLAQDYAAACSGEMPTRFRFA